MNRPRRAVASWLSTLLAVAALGDVSVARTPTASPAPRPQVQEPKSQETYIALRDQRRQDEVFTKADWELDYDAARERAERESKLIFAYFTRSYAPSPPCTRLERGILSQPGFAEFGKRVVLFCHITSGVDGDPHQDLLRKKGGRGFPYLAFLKADGTFLTAITYPRTRQLEEFEAVHQACVRFLALRARAAKGDETVAADLLIARLEMGTLSFAEAKVAVAALRNPSPEAKVRIDDLLLGLDVQDAMKNVHTQAQAAEVGRRFVAMWEEDRVPKGRAAARFFAAIMETAIANEDPALYERAMREFEKVARQGPNRQRVLDYLQKRLETLKKKAGGERKRT